MKDEIGRESRRRFLRRAGVVGLVSAIPTLWEEQARADIFKPSAGEQRIQGDEAAQQVLMKYKEVSDERSEKFERVGRKLAGALSDKDRSTWDYRFHVIESPQINAFALPGGSMFMFTGLMDRLKSDDELAAVTGHEMTHVRKEHWAKAVANARKRHLEFGVLLGITRAGPLARAGAGLTDLAIGLKYSRSEEDEADAGGLQNMADAGFDPRGMVSLFKTLQEATSGQGEPPEFLSNHPLTAERIQKTEERIAKMEKQKAEQKKEP